MPVAFIVGVEKKEKLVALKNRIFQPVSTERTKKKYITTDSHHKYNRQPQNACANQSRMKNVRTINAERKKIDKNSKFSAVDNLIFLKLLKTSGEGNLRKRRII